MLTWINIQRGEVGQTSKIKSLDMECSVYMYICGYKEHTTEIVKTFKSPNLLQSNINA